MIVINDFALFEPWYLRNEFRPSENGLDHQTLALAFSRCQSKTLQYVLSAIPPSLASSISTTNTTTASEDEKLSAELQVVGVYFWDLVYRKYPAEYDEFCRYQHYEFDQLFPAARYRGAEVLEMGCGTGKLTEHILPHARRVFAVDAVAQMITMARRKFANEPRLSFIVADLRDLPFRDNSVDHIVSNLAFRYGGAKNGVAVLERLRLIVRAGGEIRMTVGNVLSQDLLVSQGFKEIFRPRGLRYDVPANASIIGRCLYELAVRSIRNANEAATPEKRHYMCSAQRWSLRWSLHNLLAARQEPWHFLFYGGRFRSPIGMPVYQWTKA